MSIIFTQKEFIDKLNDAAAHKTHYIKGCFGAPMNSKNKSRYTQNTDYNKTHAAEINSLSHDTFGFDCVCLIKGLLWGWNGNQSKTYGGANYKSNGVPDMGADSILTYCDKVSSDFSGIIPGEVVWMSGHVGVYIGGGQCIECTPKWSNNVQYTNLGNIGNNTGHSRNWKKHGRLQWIEYGEEEAASDDPVYYVVAKGDNLTKIAKRYDTTVAGLVLLNGLENPNKIYVGQKLRIR